MSPESRLARLSRLCKNFKLMRRRPPGDTPAVRARRSVTAQEPDEAALHINPVGTEDSGFVGFVGRFESDRGAAPAQPLQGDLNIVDERHDDRAVFGGVAALDNDR